MKIAGLASAFILMLGFSEADGQKNTPPFNKQESFTPKKPIICYRATGDANTYVPPPAKYLAWRKNQTGRTKTATFVVDYDGFSNEAKGAFQAAVEIWETLIVSSVPIHISAFWRSLDSNVLGSASPGTYIRNFEGAQKLGIWYPVSMAEKISHQELNDSTDPDIVATFNSDNTNWDFNTQGIPVAGKYDMVSVVLHEIGHGLGITHSYEVIGVNGQIRDFFSNTPVVFEAFLENQANTNLVTGFQSPSIDLATQLTGQSLTLNSPLILANNNGLKGVIYAPANYSAGSSIAHLNDDSYPIGTENSLMTPFINTAEAIHDPGPITMSILKDMGWNNILIQHSPLQSTEDISKDFPVICKIKSDTAYYASSFKLFYNEGGKIFTSKTMTPTGNPNEFQSFIPKTGTTITYNYFFSLTDNAQRTFVNPGQEYKQGTSSVTQSVFTFTAGPDTEPPHITHSPKVFIRSTETQVKIEAIVLDNISIKKVEVEYLINNVAQTILTMTNTKDSTYEATISLSVELVQGDKITYRIKATDNSAAQNIATAPSSDYYTVNVFSIAPAQDSYSNNFNSTPNDFFGDAQFSIATPIGFNDGAIHSQHPYPNGTGANFESNFVYQLRVPIKLKPANATLKFDEIVLAEPGDLGSVFGSSSFFDYVIVEGSKDGGATWKPFADGYDSRSQSTWLSKWNSSSDTETQPNSTAEGDPSLFISHSIDMLANNNFASGDEVVIRFRLFADQLVHGWGWAIDNLKIQIDEIAPVILHNHSDFLISNAASLNIATKVTDASGLKDLIIEYSVNNGALTSLPLVVTPGVDQYTLNLTLGGSGIVTGDEIHYRIKATDPSNNSATLPVSGFFNVPLLDFGSPITTYVSDFNSANTDFVGNFFSIDKPALFANGAIHSAHPYLNGFGLDNTSNFQFMLKKPVVIDATNSFLSFNEIVITEFGGTVKDFVVVEGSKDNGITWQPLVDSYTSSIYPDWAVAFSSGIDGKPSLFKNRLLDITKTGKFTEGDVVLFRFRLTANSTTNGWGWAIDDLSIQGPITGLEKVITNSFLVYPNPVSSDYFTIALPPKFHGAIISLINLQGQSVINTTFQSNEEEQKIYVSNIADGMYLVRVTSEAGVLIEKIVVKR